MIQTASIVRNHAGMTRALLFFLPRRAAGAVEREAGFRRGAEWGLAVSYTHLTLPTTPYV